jgi:hypothetical protein
MSKKIKGAFWPDLKKVGCAKIQRELNCDPSVARWFATHLVVMKAPHAPVYLFEASEDQWKDIAKTWESESEKPLPKLPTDPRLH